MPRYLTVVVFLFALLAVAPAGTLEAQALKLAFIGDSYTCGVGDGTPTTDALQMTCSSDRPGCQGPFSPSQPTWARGWITDPFIFWGEFYNYGYIPKLYYYLYNEYPGTLVVAVCCRGGASSKDALDYGCAAKVQAQAPTHTFVFLGINDNAKNIAPADSRSNVATILDSIPSGEKYCMGSFCPPPNPQKPTIHKLDANWAGNPPVWQLPEDPNCAVYDPPRLQNPCSAHPNHRGYWNFAQSIRTKVVWP